MINDNYAASSSSSSYCRWRRSNETKETLVNALPELVKNAICFPCPSIEERLLRESKLSPESDEYALLKTVLFDHLTFDNNNYDHDKPCTFDGEKLLLEEDKDRVRLHAIVAGSYPARLGRAVKKHKDVDVFVVASQTTAGRRKTLDHLLWLLHWSVDRSVRPPQFGTAGMDANLDYGGCLLAVRNFGNVQLILKHYDDEEKHDACLCDFHLHSCFFDDFHHCTRWRLDVFEGFFLVRYMSLERDGRPSSEKVMCRKTSIRVDDVEKRKRRRRDESCLMRTNKEFSTRYPYKHKNNVVDFGPPKLWQQALHVILKSARADDDDDEDAAAAAAAAASVAKMKKNDEDKNDDAV